MSEQHIADRPVVTISRAKWLRNTPSVFEGKYPGGFLLFKTEREDYAEFSGKMCCMGFTSCQLGRFTKEEILGIDMPCRLRFGEKIKPLPRWLTDKHGDADKLAAINDSRKLSDHEKEAGIIEIFGKHGIKVVFTK